MKKILIFMMFAFSVVCYASPPPVPDIVTEDFQFVLPDEIQNVQTIEAQEVAFVYLGNFEMIICYSEFGLKQVYDVVVPEATVIDISYLQLNELNKPPALTDMQAFNQKFQLNKQNSNYGYPLTGDTCRA